MDKSEKRVTLFFNGLAKELHQQQRDLLNYPSGTPRPIPFAMTYEKLALLGTEVSELIKAFHKDLPAEHIRGFSGEEEEAADVILRVLDYAGARKLRIGEAIVAKINANAERGLNYGKQVATVPRSIKG